MRRPSRASSDARAWSRRAESGLDHQGAVLVAVEAEGAGLVVDLRAADVGGRVALDQGLLLAAAAAADRGGEAPRHGGAHLVVLLHPPDEQLQVGSTEPRPDQGAPRRTGGEAAQVGGVAAPGGAAAAGQEAGAGGTCLDGVVGEDNPWWSCSW